MSESKMVRSIRISDPHWCQLEIEAIRSGYRTRHKFIAAQLLKIVNASIEKAPDTV